MSRKILLREDQVDLLKSMASIISVGDKQYFFMPYWFEQIGIEGEFIVHSLEQPLPYDLEEAIKSFR